MKNKSPSSLEIWMFIYEVPFTFLIQDNIQYTFFSLSLSMSFLILLFQEVPHFFSLPDDFYGAYKMSNPLLE